PARPAVYVLSQFGGVRARQKYPRARIRAPPHVAPRRGEPGAPLLRATALSAQASLQGHAPYNPGSIPEADGDPSRAGCAAPADLPGRAFSLRARGGAAAALRRSGAPATGARPRRGGRGLPPLSRGTAPQRRGAVESGRGPERAGTLRRGRRAVPRGPGRRRPPHGGAAQPRGRAAEGGPHGGG